MLGFKAGPHIQISPLDHLEEYLFTDVNVNMYASGMECFTYSKEFQGELTLTSEHSLRDPIF
jgi:hypothetical protein